MLLTLSISSLRRELTTAGGTIALRDVPGIAIDELGLRGLALETSLLAGVDLSVIDELRDAADKAPCPCLFLIEDQAHPLGDPDEERVEPSLHRIERVLRVAHRLGCSSVALTISAQPRSPRSAKHAISHEDHIEFVAARLKEVVKLAERLELNIVIEPEPGTQQAPDHLTTLIRRVGGFRIGSFPDFAIATEHDNPVQYLRSLVPYASVVGVPTSHQPIKAQGSTESLGTGGPGAYDLSADIAAVRAVGYDAALLIKHRAASDPIPAINATRQALEQLLDDTPAPQASAD